MNLSLGGGERAPENCSSLSVAEVGPGHLEVWVLTHHWGMRGAVSEHVCARSE